MTERGEGGGYDPDAEDNKDTPVTPDVAAEAETETTQETPEGKIDREQLLTSIKKLKEAFTKRDTPPNFDSGGAGNNEHTALEVLGNIKFALEHGTKPENIKLNSLQLAYFDQNLTPLATRKNVMPSVGGGRGLHRKGTYEDLSADFKVVSDFVERIRNAGD